jgi:hypothetical protein
MEMAKPVRISYRNLPPNGIRAFLDVYKQLIHALIVFSFFLKHMTNAEYKSSSLPVMLKSTLATPSNFLCV